MEKKFNDWEQLLRCTELNSNELRLLMIILNYHNLDGWTDGTSLEELNVDCGLSAPTISKCIKGLEDKGLIKTKVLKFNKNSLKLDYDFMPQYEAIQEMIGRYPFNSVLYLKNVVKVLRYDKENKTIEVATRQVEDTITNG